MFVFKIRFEFSLDFYINRYFFYFNYNILLNKTIWRKKKFITVGLYAMWLFYTTPPIIVSGIYTLLPTNETYSARFLYRLEHVLDVDKYYNLLMLHGFISVFYIVSVPIAVDSLFTLCIQHVCALFRCMK